MSFEVRRASQAELTVALDWAAAEGWNPGLHDAASFWAADPEGYFLGLLDGEPAAFISAVRYGDDFGFLGFYLVRPGLRGRGYGLKVWAAGLEHLAGRNVGLDGVLEQQENYRRSGFTLAYRNVRYEGTGASSASSSALTPLSALPFEAVASYDELLFGAPRREFLQRWTAQPGSLAFGKLVNGQLAGYGVLRPCREGYKAGPLFADDPDVAEEMFAAMRAFAGGGVPLYLDVPEANQAAVALAERHGMHPVFETARMYNRQAPDLPLDKVFGVTTFELG
jgi:ribosomal protein S18 acetylase RimI-like enzyme